MRDFENQTSVITGASSGIGKAIALKLASQGAVLSLVGRSLDRLESVAEIARKTAKQAFCYQCDLTIDADLQRIVNSLKDDFEHIDILIHSAGEIFLGPVETASVEEFDRQYRTNVRAPYVLTQALLPLLSICQGQIVFINSSAGLRANANAAQYSATKFALKAIADSLREEVNAEGVRVLSVFPGRTATPMQAAVFKAEGREYRPERLTQPEDVAGIILNSLLLPRSVEATEIFIRPMKKYPDE